MFRHILIAHDGSEAARKAFGMATQLAVATGAKLSLLSVARPPEIGDDIETEAMVERSQEQFQQLHDTLRREQEALGRTLDTEIYVGHPAEQILRYADDYQVDHIVIGHRGKSVLQRWLVGSVSRQVIDHARCSVTVVR